MHPQAAPRATAIQVVKLVGVGLIVILLTFVGIIAIVNQLRRESAVLDESPELIVELLDDQGTPYREPVSFTYQANCGPDLVYQPPTNRPMHGGRGTIPILCPTKTVTELRINIFPADPSCSTPMATTTNVVYGLTLRYRVTCTR